MNHRKYAVALIGLVASKLAVAGGPVVPVGVALGFVVGDPVGASLAQATGLPLEALGGSAVLAIAAIALVVGIRIVRRKQGR